MLIVFPVECSGPRTAPGIHQTFSKYILGQCLHPFSPVGLCSSSVDHGSHLLCSVVPEHEAWHVLDPQLKTGFEHWQLKAKTVRKRQEYRSGEGGRSLGSLQ